MFTECIISIHEGITRSGAYFLGVGRFGYIIVNSCSSQPVSRKRLGIVIIILEIHI